MTAAKDNALSALAANHQTITDARTRELTLVADALNAGANWEEIADQIGLRRQHAHRKYAHQISTTKTTTYAVKPAEEA